MSADAPWVSVVIPHYNDVARLRRCLEALRADPDAAGAQVIVADNGSTGDVAAAMAAFPDARLVLQPQPGAGAARNRGAAEAEAELLFFLDADCVPQPGWLAAGRAALATADVVGGEVEVFDETPPPRSGAEAFETVFAFRQRDYVERKGFSVSANLLTRRHVFADVGPFGVGMSEDVDWCRRATARGWRLAYAPAARVAHPTRSDMPALLRKWRRMTDEGFVLNGAGAAARLRWAARALAVLASPAVHAGQVLTSPRLATPRERLAALRTLVALRGMRAAWMMRQALTGRPTPPSAARNA